MDATTCPASFLDVPPSERRPMTEDETKNFMSAIIADMQDSKPGDFSKLEGTLPHATIVHRLKSAGIDLSLGGLLGMVAWTSDRPGDMVMWAYTASQIAKTSGTKLITCNDLVDAFPFGIPTEEARKKIWDAQKIPAEKRENGMSDNYLDMLEFWS
jgi:hypothetical protein